ncbi:LmbE family protein [Hydrogenobacter thermophilus TK-6]|uniref:LmbE family protein n=1 Tax=Hydrogenobacter thermophilus (strain DSM 6534 / IAM 12695 / TK-6) TaxID=608538 RepID=D3DJM3_HYDTT|nr:PIG-L family deacetylase [Hydrogenobacter thermophilus]ADO45948.1 LmbE family protein [Hydrogenobacter thermophilus TK-6]BAI70025.1 LmbE family protein [Hydrogenobacter thermophilus TK-6]
MEGKNEKGYTVVIAPHFDDEVIGCGGTIYQHTAKGDEVHLYVLTDGSKLYEKTDTNKRKEECLSAARLLGISTVNFLDFKEGELANHLDELKSALGGILKNFQKVYAPHPFDHHSDHIAASLAVLSVFEESPTFELRLYGVYNTFRHNLLVDVTDVYPIKKKALLNYSYSLGNSYIWIKRTEAFMKYPTIYTVEDRLYEAFLVIDQPMTVNEILNFLSYGVVCDDPHNQLLKKIKSAQMLMGLLNEERNIRLSLEDSLKTNQEELEMLKVHLKNHQEELQKLKSSIFFKMYDVYHTLKPKIFPEGSLRERIYRKLVNIIKGV